MKLVARMDELTWTRFGERILDNARLNQSRLEHGKSLAELRDRQLTANDSAIIVAAGPSIKRKDPLATIRELGYDGTLVATESALSYFLRSGTIPHLVVTLDPHESRIVRWFGDPKLDAEIIKYDDYFRRQDMDENFANELAANEVVLSMLNRHGCDINIALSTSSSPAVVDRVLETGMNIYWWNPMLDDPDSQGSLSRELHRSNGLPLVNSGGNVGSACWMMADAVLNTRRVALTGMDFGYYMDTPYNRTQYYREAVELVGEENLRRFFIKIFNPHLDGWFYTDPAYMWYRESFLEMAAESNCKTVNCTEGGILFGDHVPMTSLKSFLQSESSC